MNVDTIIALYKMTGEPKIIATAKRFISTSLSLYIVSTDRPFYNRKVSGKYFEKNVCTVLNSMG